MFSLNQVMKKFSAAKKTIRANLRELDEYWGIKLVPLFVGGMKRRSGHLKYTVKRKDTIYFPRLPIEYMVTYQNSTGIRTLRAVCRYRDRWTVEQVRWDGRPHFYTVHPKQIISIEPRPPEFEDMTDVESWNFRELDEYIKEYESSRSPE